jgi:hypothetical protein
MLPLVKDDIKWSVSHDLIGTDRELINVELEKIRKDNPFVYEWIKSWSNVNLESRVQVALSGIIVYKLLKSQDEANEMLNALKI